MHTEARVSGLHSCRECRELDRRILNSVSELHEVTLRYSQAALARIWARDLTPGEFNRDSLLSKKRELTIELRVLRDLKAFHDSLH